MNIATVSSQRQITLPKELLSQINAGIKSKVLVDVVDGVITVKPLKSSIVEELAGSLTKYVHPSKLGVPFSKIMEETKRKVARKLAKE